MVSRRKYFVIFLMMAVLLFLFQFSQVMRENWNHYSNNEYAYNNLPTAQKAWSAEKNGSMVGGKITSVLYVGQRDSEVGKVVRQWSSYTKSQLEIAEELAKYVQVKTLPTMVLIDAENVSPSDYLGSLESYTRYGVGVVFLTLPNVETIEQNEKLREVLGITEVVKERVKVEGIRLFEGSLLGGEAYYQAQTTGEKEALQDLELTLPWYVTGKGSKTYMVGLLNERAYVRESFPRIIWRNIGENGTVFAVNGNYMKDETGFGFLDLFLYEMSEYALYPVINAQNTLLVDFPDFSGADEEAVAALYSRSAQGVQRDIFWPSIYSMITRNSLRPTCFFMTQYEQDVPATADPEYVDFYLQQINEVGAEAGRSLHYGEGMTLAQKTAKDRKFYKDTGCNYDFRAACMEAADEKIAAEWQRETGYTGITTIAARAEGKLPLVSYFTEKTTLQGITHEAGKYSYAQNLKTKSLLTSIGYTNMLVDFHRVLWPESEEDSWENYFDLIYSNISSYWTNFMMYDQTTLSQSDYRVRNFLNLDYAQHRRGDTIRLMIRNGGDDCYFLLRTHEEQIASVQNGEYRKLEKDVYLLHVTGNHMEITLRDAEEVLQYHGPFGR